MVEDGASPSISEVGPLDFLCSLGRAMDKAHSCHNVYCRYMIELYVYKVSQRQFRWRNFRVTELNKCRVEKGKE